MAMENMVILSWLVMENEQASNAEPSFIFGVACAPIYTRLTHWMVKIFLTRFSFVVFIIGVISLLVLYVIRVDGQLDKLIVLTCDVKKLQNILVK